MFQFLISGATGGSSAPPIRDKKQEKAQEDLSKHLQNTKSLLLGSDSSSSAGCTDAGGNSGGNQSDIIVAQLSQEVYNSGLLLLLLRNLHMVDFEGKKDAVQVFNNLLRRQIGTRTPTVEYICTKVIITILTNHW